MSTKITFADKEDIRQINLPPEKYLSAADINEIKTVVNKNAFPQLQGRYSTVAGVYEIGINTIGAFTYDSPATGIGNLTFAAGTFTDKTVVVQLHQGENSIPVWQQIFINGGNEIQISNNNIAGASSNLSGAFLSISVFDTII